MCRLAQRCPGLHTLNVTGCVEISLGGLRGLVCGVGEAYVQEARTFFGFVPKRDSVYQRVGASYEPLEDPRPRCSVSRPHVSGAPFAGGSVGGPEV